MLAGPDDRLTEARERQGHYFREHPADSDLDYLRVAIARLERYDATRTLVDRHNPLHLAEMSPDAATGLLDFWRRIDPDTDVLVHDFRDGTLLRVRLHPHVMAADLRGMIGRRSADLVAARPDIDDIDDDAVKGLKFSVAVPGELGRQTLAERLADPGAVQACVRATIHDVVP